MINIKYKKKVGLLIKGINILSLKQESETSPTPTDMVTLCLARQMYTPKREMATVYLLYR